MIKVTLGEKPKEEKPFPKLMIDKEGRIVLALSQNTGHTSGDRYNVLKINGFGGDNCVYMTSFCLFDRSNPFSDYNEPITLQNA